MVFRKTRTLEAVSWRNTIVDTVQKHSKKLHFVDLNHGQRVAACLKLSELPVRITSVLAAKLPIPKDVYIEKNQLYFYMTRYLIERISWLCRDMRKLVPEGNGSVEIMFSRRGGMSYNDFRDYLILLKDNGRDDIRIHWPVIDISAVSAQDHSRIAALQIADIAASSISSALEPDRFGNCEARYANSLKNITYNRHRNYLSYGLKIVPKHEDCGLNAQQMEFISNFS
jgi:hypothetical protein